MKTVNKRRYRRRNRITRRGGMKRSRSPEHTQHPPPKYQGVTVPVGIPVQQTPGEPPPPMGVPLGRGLRNSLIRRKRKSQKRKL